MDTQIAFNTNCYFTGAPASALEHAAIAIHRLAEAATGGGIHFIDQQVWIDPESIFLHNGPERAKKLFSIAEIFLNAQGSEEQQQGLYLLRGPLDFVALAKMNGIKMSSEFEESCRRLLKRVQLLVFQLPDPQAWRSKGFDEKRTAWFMRYTKTLFEILLEHGLKFEQLRVLPPQRGDANGIVIETAWRLFGVSPNPLNVTEMIKPLPSIYQNYSKQYKELFERKDGSLFGNPYVV